MNAQLAAEIRGRATLIDLVLLAAVPWVLAVAFALPEPIKLEYALVYTDPTILTAFTAHFVHFEPLHLWSNLLGYAAVVPLAYVFSLLSGRRIHFLAAYATFLVAFPLVLSGLNVLLVRPRVGFGFSGILLAFVGFLPATLLWYLETQFAGDFRVGHSPLLFFLGAAIIAVWGAPLTPGSVVAALLAVAAMAAYARAVFDDLALPVRVWLRGAARRVGYFEVAVAGASLAVLFPLAAFPPDPTGAGRVLNIYSHLLGYNFGYIVPYLTFGILGVSLD